MFKQTVLAFALGAFLTAPAFAQGQFGMSAGPGGVSAGGSFGNFSGGASFGPGGFSGGFGSGGGQGGGFFPVPEGSGLRNGLPPTVMDSFVQQSGDRANSIYGFEGDEALGDAGSGFDPSRRIARGIEASQQTNEGLTTGHGSYLPSAWGADEMLPQKYGEEQNGQPSGPGNPMNFFGGNESYGLYGTGPGGGFPGSDMFGRGGGPGGPGFGFGMSTGGRHGGGGFSAGGSFPIP